MIFKWRRCIVLHDFTASSGYKAAQSAHANAADVAGGVNMNIDALAVVIPGDHLCCKNEESGAKHLGMGEATCPGLTTRTVAPAALRAAMLAEAACRDMPTMFW